MSVHFTPYEGDMPYLFISYAHADAEKVLPILKELHHHRYRIWYDTGIEAGANWPEVIAGHLSKASKVLFFVSPRFPISQNCVREVNFTVDLKLPLATVFLDPVELPAGMKMQLSDGAELGNTAEEIIQSGILGEEFIGDGVEGYGLLQEKKPRKLNTGMVVGIIGLLIAAGSMTALLGVTQGWFGGGAASQIVTVSDEGGEGSEQVQVTKWTSGVMRDLLISQADSTALYLCGNCFVTSRIGIQYDDGVFRVAGEPVEQGDLKNLNAIADKPDLVELALCRQKIVDASALSALTQLAYLDLSGNEVADLSPLASLDKLTTLKVCHTKITDLTPILEMSSLQELYISYDMVPYAETVLGEGFDIIITK